MTNTFNVLLKLRVATEDTTVMKNFCFELFLLLKPFVMCLYPSDAGKEAEFSFLPVRRP